MDPSGKLIYTKNQKVPFANLQMRQLQKARGCQYPSMVLPSAIFFSSSMVNITILLSFPALYHILVVLLFPVGHVVIYRWCARQQMYGVSELAQALTSRTCSMGPIEKPVLSMQKRSYVFCTTITSSLIESQRSILWPTPGILFFPSKCNSQNSSLLHNLLL